MFGGYWVGAIVLNLIFCIFSFLCAQAIITLVVNNFFFGYDVSEKSAFAVSYFEFLLEEDTF